jgi:hypothetical protein
MTLLTSSKQSWEQKSLALEEALRSRASTVKLRFWAAGTDFDFASQKHADLYNSAGGFDNDVALLVRPDQHILGVFKKDADVEELVGCILEHLGYESGPRL